jgi:hypothetical protein
MAHLTGVAGEHFAAAELAKRDFLVTLTRGPIFRHIWQSFRINFK